MPPPNTADEVSAATISTITTKLAETSIAELTPPPTPLSPKPFFSTPTTSPPFIATTVTSFSADKLRMSGSQFRNANPIHKLIIGAVIFKDDKILLLKRHSDGPCLYPLRNRDCFELPSSDVDAEVLYDALATRAVFKNTGLQVTTILEELLPPIKCDYLYVKDGQSTLEPCIQLNFNMEIEAGGEDICVDAEVYSGYAWMAEGELDGAQMTTAVRKMVKNAFASRFL